MTVKADIAALAPSTASKTASRSATRNIESLIFLAGEKVVELDLLLAETAVTLDAGDTATATAIGTIRAALA